MKKYFDAVQDLITEATEADAESTIKIGPLEITSTDKDGFKYTISVGQIIISKTKGE